MIVLIGPGFITLLPLARISLVCYLLGAQLLKPSQVGTCRPHDKGIF